MDNTPKLKESRDLLESFCFGMLCYITSPEYQNSIEEELGKLAIILNIDKVKTFANCSE